MKIRGLVLAAVVFLVLAGVLYWSNRRKPETEPAKASAEAPPAILKLDQNSIEKLERGWAKVGWKTVMVGTNEPKKRIM